MKPKRTWRWVSRDAERDDIDIWPSVGKPLWDGYMWVLKQGQDFSAQVCSVEFVELFGFAPKHGTCIKVEFTAKVVKS